MDQHEPVNPSSPASPTRVRPQYERRNYASREALIRRVTAEFGEMPGLRLTLHQGARLLSVRQDICVRVFRTLVKDGVLCEGPDGRFAWRAERP